MKAEIDSQAKNEVEELLQDYVVSPLNTDMIAALQKTEDTFGRETAEKAEAVKKSVSSQIGALQRGLKGQLEAIGEQLETELPNAIEDSQAAVCKTLSKLAGTIQTELSNRSTTLEQSVTATAQSMDRSLDGLKAQLTDLTQRTDAAFSRLSQQVEADLAQMKDAGSDNAAAVLRSLDHVSDALERERSVILDRLAALEQALSAARERDSTELAELRNEWKAEAEQYQILTEKRYKTLFTASLAIGAANLLAVLGLLLTHLL